MLFCVSTLLTGISLLQAFICCLQLLDSQNQIESRRIIQSIIGITALVSAFHYIYLCFKDFSITYYLSIHVVSKSLQLFGVALAVLAIRHYVAVSWCEMMRTGNRKTLQVLLYCQLVVYSLLLAALVSTSIALNRMWPIYLLAVIYYFCIAILVADAALSILATLSRLQRIHERIYRKPMSSRQTHKKMHTRIRPLMSDSYRKEVQSSMEASVNGQKHIQKRKPLQSLPELVRPKEASISEDIKGKMMKGASEFDENLSESLKIQMNERICQGDIKIARTRAFDSVAKKKSNEALQCSEDTKGIVDFQGVALNESVRSKDLKNEGSKLNLTLEGWSHGKVGDGENCVPTPNKTNRLSNNNGISANDLRHISFSDDSKSAPNLKQADMASIVPDDFTSIPPHLASGTGKPFQLSSKLSRPPHFKCTPAEIDAKTSTLPFYSPSMASVSKKKCRLSAIRKISLEFEIKEGRKTDHKEKGKASFVRRRLFQVGLVFMLQSLIAFTLVGLYLCKLVEILGKEESESLHQNSTMFWICEAFCILLLSGSHQYAWSHVSIPCLTTSI